jgi:hypothetical protein
MKVFLAGVYSRPYLIEKHNPLFVLESYHYAKDNLKFVDEIIKHKIDFLLDSGAFSYFGGGEVDWDNYVTDYIAFIKKYNIQNFIELDLYSLIGIDKTEKLRKRIETETGKKTIPVFHKRLGVDYYKNLCKEYDYIAISASGMYESKWTRQEPDRLEKMVRYAKSKRVKVHGLGYTKIDMLKKIPFYSVDSTSWLSGSRFANIYRFNGDGIKQYSKEKNQKMKNYKIIDNNNFSEWVKFQKYAEREL